MYFCRKQAVKILLDAGADPNVKPKRGDPGIDNPPVPLSPLGIAMFRHEHNIGELVIVEVATGGDAFAPLADWDNPWLLIVNDLLKAGADPNEKLPLKNNHVDRTPGAIAWLLRRNGGVSSTENGRMSPAEFVSELELGDDQSSWDYSFKLYCHVGYTEVTKYFLESGMLSDDGIRAGFGKAAPGGFVEVLRVIRQNAHAFHIIDAATVQDALNTAAGHDDCIEELSSWLQALVNPAE